jgi:tetratricopeptide (TPR) repeat protein
MVYHHTKSIIYNHVLIVIMDDRAVNNNDGNAKKKPMNLFKRIESWIKTNVAPPQPPKPDPNLAKLYELIYHARTLRRAGQYDEVLKELDAILALADEKMIFGIRINQADILIRKKDFASASAILNALDTDEQLISDEHRAHLAIKWGIWWKAQQNWEEAQTYFEQAVEFAQRANRNNFVCLATSYLAHVYLEQGNATYALHLMDQAFPLLQVNSEVDIDSYFAGVYGLAMLEAGRPNGRQMLEHALKLAQGIEHREYQLLWLDSLGMDSLRVNLFDEARNYFLQVVEKLDTTDDEAYIQALCHLSRAYYTLNAPSALEHAQQAEAQLTENHPERLRIQVFVTLGIAYRINNNGDQALHYLRMIDGDVYRQFTLSPAEYSYSDYVRNLAGAYLLQSDFSQSEQIYEQALNSGVFTPLETANIQRDKGIYHVYRKQYQEAIQIWMTALKYYEANYLYNQTARLYCDIGNIRRLIGQGRRAFKDYEQALMVLNSFDDPETRGLVLSNAATIYVDFGDIATAESFFIESIQIAQQLRDTRTESIRRGNYGWFLLNTGRATTALNMLQHAVDQSQTLDMPLHTAIQIDNIGLAWHELKDYEQSLSYHTQAWQLLQGLSGIDAYWRGIVGANLAHAFISAQKLEGVAELIETVLKIGREINRQELVVQALNSKMRLLLLQPDDQEHLRLLADEAVSLAQLQGRRRLLADALILRQQVYNMLGRVEEAEQDWEKAKSLLRMLRLNPADYQPTER